MRRLAIPLFMLVAATAGLMAQSTNEALRRQIVEVAQKYRGVPYVYGAESPEAFDCSGFVRFIYREAAGLALPRNSRSQYEAGEAVETAAMRPGDLLAFDTVGAGVSHVAIYLGGGSMIHAASSGPRTGVIVSALDDRYFGPRLVGVRSFLGDGGEGGARLAAKSAQPSPPAPQAPAPSAPGGAAAQAPGSRSAPGLGLETGAEAAVAQIGFTLTGRLERYADPIPAAIGTSLAFTVRNGRGKDGRFVVIFYKTEKDFSRSTEIHREISTIPAGEALELPPYAFTEAGTYKLIVKDNWNSQLMERVFRVVEGRN